MSKNLKTSVFFLINLFFFCAAAIAEEEEHSVIIEPRIYTRFFTADAVQMLPKLKHLKAKDPWFNKILFKVEGYPVEQNLILEVKRLAGANPDQFHPILNFSIQQDGSYVVNDEQKKNIESSSRGYLPGERVIYRIRTADGSISREISRIPVPVIFEEKEGKIGLWAELLSVSPTVYLIELPTMKEGEEYDLKSTTIGNTIKAKPKFTENKPFHFSPAPKGKSQGGESLLEIRRKSGEVYRVKLPWGTALEAYLDGNHAYHSSN